ncbi:MAG: hypothetical protein M1822_002464 [Bathelium mastoideum]|nr:MAG: hypothetical protein M1822_002464 [Bathelium mastoideum]
MPIHPLPPSTTSPLHATVLLPDPPAIAKELIDNALDAHATSILLTLSSSSSSASSSSSSSSPFALDTLTLRDNGHGVAPIDRPLLGRAHHTSKARDTDTSTTTAIVAGGTGRSSLLLGFRGAALAAMIAVVRSVRVTTRVAGEATGVRMVLLGGQQEEGEDTGIVSGAGFGDAREERVSAPVGTTVEVSGVFERMPVRRRVLVEKAGEGGSWVARVKRLVHGYALVRPGVRFEVKVKGKGGGGGRSEWVFVPRAGEGVEVAVVKVLGSGCVRECEWHVRESEGYEFRALLPRVEALREKVSGIGQFMSVDGRVMDVKKGTMKKMVRLCKERMRGASLEVSREWAMVLNMTCPRGSYDVNVEPAKDDVIFENEPLVLGGWEKLLEEAYPTRPEQDHIAPELTESQAPTHNADTERILNDLSDDGIAPTTGRRRSVRSDMYQPFDMDDEDEIPLFRRSVSGENEIEVDEEQEQVTQDVSISNPWVIAKMNAPLRCQRDEAAPRDQSAAAQDPTRELQQSFATPKKRPGLFDNVPYLPTPQASSSPTRAPRSDRSLESMGIFPYASSPRRVDEAEQSAATQASRAPTISYSTPQPLQGTPLSMVPDITPPAQRKRPKQKPSQGNVNKPFVSPVSTRRREDAPSRNANPSRKPSQTKCQRDWRKTVEDRAENLVVRGEEAAPLESPPNNRRIEEFMTPQNRFFLPHTPSENNENFTLAEGFHRVTRPEAQANGRHIGRRNSGLKEIINNASGTAKVRPDEERSLGRRIRRSPTAGSEAATGNTQDDHFPYIPLERVPIGASTQNLSVTRSAIISVTSEQMRKLDHGDAHDSPYWGSSFSIIQIPTALTNRNVHDRLLEWSQALHALLSRTEQVVDLATLEQLLSRALERHAADFAAN